MDDASDDYPAHEHCPNQACTAWTPNRTGRLPFPANPETCLKCGTYFLFDPELGSVPLTTPLGAELLADRRRIWDEINT